MTNILAFLLALLVASPAVAQESWLCVGENATGFTFNKNAKKWEAGKQVVNRYEFRRVRGGDANVANDVKWILLLSDDSSLVTSCNIDFDSDLIFCGYFYFNKMNHRFQIAFLHGYATK